MSERWGIYWSGSNFGEVRKEQTGRFDTATYYYNF
jgi:hypothetical protein